MAERVDWVELLDPRSGEPNNVMFANIQTGECLWEPPSTASVKKSSKNQWWELYDENTRRYYYYNAHTKQTEWRKPKESDIITLAKLQNLKGKGSKRRSSSTRKDGSQRRRSSSTRKDGKETSSHGDGDRGSLPRKYSRHNSKENLAQLRKHSRSSQSGNSKPSRGHSSKDKEKIPHDEPRTSESSSRTRSGSAHSSADLREHSGSFDEQIGQEVDDTCENVQGDSENELGSIQDGSTTDMDTDISSLHEVESTTRDIEYLKISGEITDESESNDTSFSKTDNISSGRRSNCSMNQSNYVSDGPLSESETSALNDSFHSCDSKFEEANSEEKLQILVSEASPPKEEEEGSRIPCQATGETRIHSFFNKMVDKEGNLLRPCNIIEDVSKKRHASEGENSDESPALVLRGDRGGRRRSNSLDCKTYDNVSYSIYDNLSPTSDQEIVEEDKISLTDKLTGGGMTHKTAALVEACDPIQELPTIVEPESESHAPDSDINAAVKQAQENGRVGCGLPKPPPRPLHPPPIHNQLRVTKLITRSNTCPTSPGRVPPLPPSPISLHKFSDHGFPEQRRSTSLFGKKDNLISGMLVHSRAPIKKPVINTRDKRLKKEAVELFKLVQVHMGDRSVRNKTADETLLEIVTKAWAYQPLRDELYCQLIKQTTDNNISSSLKLGWELMAVCLAMFPPSAKYHSHLEGYVYRHLKDNLTSSNPIVQQEISNLVAQYADNCHCKLEKMAKTGSRKGQRQPTQAEVDAAKRAIFQPSMFGSTLDDTMKMQKSRYPDHQLPWILTCLTQQVIQNNGTCTEGIFRVPGDIDEVNALKVKTDTWSYPDDVTDANVAASLLKQWFRDLKEPLIDESSYENCVSSCDDEMISRAIVFSLPPVNQLVLCYILHFLQIFCDPQVIRITKMDVNNLAMVWAPNFLRCPSDEPQVILENTRKEMTFVRTLLTSLDTSAIEGVK